MTGPIICEKSAPFANTKSHSSGNSLPTAIDSSECAIEQTENADQKEFQEFQGRAAGRQRPRGVRRRGTNFSEESVSINVLGRMYQNIVGFSVITRYLVYILPVAIIIAAPILVLGLVGYNGIIMGTGKDDEGRLIEGPHLFFFLIWVECMWVGLWLIKLFAWALPFLFKVFAGIVSASVRKYVIVLQNLVKPMSFTLWSLILWLTFNELMLDHANHRDITWVRAMSKIFVATFVSSIILLAEKTLVQIIGVGYHQRSFANRIKASKRDIHLLGVLYNASRLLFPLYCSEFAEEDAIIKDSIDAKLRKKSTRLRRPRPERSMTPTAPAKIIANVSRVGGKVGNVVGSLTSEIAGKNLFINNSNHNIIIDALERQHSCEALARRIWLSFVEEGKDSLTLADFKEIMVDAHNHEVEQAFEMIDSDFNGDISLKEMVAKVSDIGDERKAIHGGMDNIGAALKAFDKVLMVGIFLLTIFIFVVMAFFKNNFVSVLTTAGTAVLSVSFAFAVTAQEFLGSCIFIFVKHPYDVGDRVDLNGNHLVVETISLLYTVFHNIDTMKVVQIANIQLNNFTIENISRSKAMVENIDIEVAYETTFDDVELLRLEMEEFVNAPENSRDFQSDFSVGCGGVGKLDKMILQISIKHKSNWHNDGVRYRRRTKFMTALATALKKVPIYPPGGGFEPLGGYLNPSYTVSVSDQFASKSREMAEELKDAVRLVPTCEAAKTGESHATAHSLPSSSAQATTSSSNRGDPRLEHRYASIADLEGHTDDNDHGYSRDQGRRKMGERVPDMTMTGESPPLQEAISPRTVDPRIGYFDIEAQTGRNSSERS